jgi:hypothetical protein
MAICGCDVSRPGEERYCEIHRIAARITGHTQTTIPLECGECHGKGAVLPNGLVHLIQHGTTCKHRDALGQR